MAQDLKPHQLSRGEGNGVSVYGDERVSNPKVSVLTPIYNVGRYLPTCLESLSSQTLQDIEFICINDGSTDESLEVALSFANSDYRFVVVDKPNSGYGASMNIGLSIARGEYVGIVESDDYADSEMFAKLYELAKSNDCDIARGNRYDLSDDHDSYREVLAGMEYGKVFRPLENQSIFDPAPCIWSQIYLRSFLEKNDIAFLETPGASFQDTGFVYKSYIAAERMILTKDAYLHYRVDNAGSSVKSSAKPTYIVDEFRSIEAFLADRPADYELFRYGLERLRVQAYTWNWRRLNWSGRSIFLPAAMDDLARGYASGSIRREDYSEEQWRILWRLIRHPRLSLLKTKVRGLLERLF